MSFFFSFESPGESATPELQVSSSSASAAAASFFIFFPVSVFKLIRTFAIQTALLIFKTIIFKLTCIREALRVDYVHVKWSWSTLSSPSTLFTALFMSLHHMTKSITHLLLSHAAWVQICAWNMVKNPVKHTWSIPHPQALRFTLRPG